MHRTSLPLLSLALCTAMATSHAHAQTDDLYRMEIGAGVGLMAYEGDFNGSVMKGQQPMASVMLRRIINPFMGLRLNLAYGKIKGGSDNASTYYPAYDTQPYTFSSSVADLSLTYEYNFWPYGTGHDYRGAKRLTPFVFAGIGATFASKANDNAKSTFTANVPIGIGVKYKVATRLNVGLEWAIHFSLSDNLDGVTDPYNVPSSGLFKNTDCYSALQLSLTYSFMAKCRTCHNADE